VHEYILPFRDHKIAKIARAPVCKTEITAVGIRRADHATSFYPQKLALTSLTSGGLSVGIVLSRTKATELNSGNPCYHSVQNLLSSRLLSKNLKIRIYKTIILLWFCTGVKLVL
jgi:hypothetical protein